MATTPSENAVRRRKPAQARSQSRMHAIVDATKELLAEGGLEAVTTNTIAARAGVPVGSVYYLYSDKHAIYQEILAQGMAELEARFARIPEGDADNWRDWVRRDMHALIQFYEEHPAFGVIYRAFRHLPDLHALDTETNARIQAGLRARIRAAIPSLSKSQADAIARTCVAISDRMTHDYIDSEDSRLRKSIVRETERALVAYLDCCERDATR